MSSWLPGCTRQDFGTNGGSWTRQPAIICVHSTEGTSWPGYNGGSDAPHFTISLTTGERRQHISMGVAARALMNPSGGVETNRGGVIQVEVIGTCDPDHKGDSGWLYLPTMSDAQADTLSRLIADIASDQGIPLTSSVTWKAYPGSYGTSNGVRLSSSAWGSYRGVLGHQHVPENDHGDPGDLDIDAILKGSDMSFDDQEQTQIRANVRNAPITLRDGSTDTLEERVAYMVAMGIENQSRITDLTNMVADLAAQAGLDT